MPGGDAGDPRRWGAGPDPAAHQGAGAVLDCGRRAGDDVWIPTMAAGASGATTARALVAGHQRLGFALTGRGRMSASVSMGSEWRGGVLVDYMAGIV
jgi:hypothetical protein